MFKKKSLVKLLKLYQLFLPFLDSSEKLGSRDTMRKMLQWSQILLLMLQYFILQNLLNIGEFVESMLRISYIVKARLSEPIPQEAYTDMVVHVIS